ncbi:MAG TPA: type II toxin-antitoxin system HicB family antitoxin [Ktedonobacteraceae bacterium]|jgi:predicted RNase H-like HicB family nuclease|nr:type II toxin-antitoxin system HicB family antitoxin [Ktedonobacteraceae bacterium]
MFADYMRAALRHARYELLAADGAFYGEISGFNGVYAEADTLEDCREELVEVLEGWILLRISKHLSLPVVDGIELSIGEPA